MSLRDVPSLGENELVDPYNFIKDGSLIAVLSDASALGQFTAYKEMKVTAEGRRRGYFDLECGDSVHTPHSKLQGGTRVQLSIRDGMLCRVLLGQRSTGRKKKTASQQDLLCLSYVEKVSRYNAKVTDVLGLYRQERAYPKPLTFSDFSWGNKDSSKLTGPKDSLNGADFAWVVTSPQYTSPYEFIWTLSWHDDDDLDFKPPPDDRTYTYDIGAYRGGQNARGGDFLGEIMAV
jgi:hypothetical protein